MEDQLQAIYDQLEQIRAEIRDLQEEGNDNFDALCVQIHESVENLNNSCNTIETRDNNNGFLRLPSHDLKVGYRPDGEDSDHTTPMIRISGKWLKQWGFSCNTKVKISATQNKLLLEVKNERDQ